MNNDRGQRTVRGRFVLYRFDAFLGADAGLAATEAPLAGLEDEILLTFPFEAISFLAIFWLLPDKPVL